MSVGERIKKFRKEKGLTQVKLAEMAGISRSYLADVESDRYNPSLSTLLDVALALNVPASCLLDDKDIDFRNLLNLCKKEGLTFISLAEKLDIPVEPFLHAIQSTKILDEETMFKIINYFDCTWDYIIGKTDSSSEIVFGDKAVSIPSTVDPVESKNIPATIAAHFEDTEFTEKETEEISDFINFITSKRNKLRP